ncbi:hypothetical protein ACXITP_04925 [Actinotignum sanguinis]|uniref:Uncharacterized protein n=4 Tax=Actinomycetaceae TaxID=2049 RepID=A0ABZ0RAL0_9ACTO|nr:MULTISPECIES: hypothetical protein [Actinotignum]WPJ88420.1 hypothetical protein R0V15_05975 [Schaalia turicensis]MDE1656985.1 hypothetical protein [Actinotignum sanguinis]MDK6372587.1 hypothetical protein [Actinotignum timonense]MDK6591259.1 hypothetical protein [Actinotignum timonense]MDK8357677.1 hypothetical protein [Actinotignum timonense]
MHPEEHASNASDETPAAPAGNAGAAVPAGMDRNAGWKLLASFMNRMKEKEQNGTWQSYRDTSDEEADTDG